MYYLVIVDHNDMAAHLSCELLWRVLRGAVYPTQGLRLIICCGVTVKRANVRSVRKMKAPTVMMEMVT